MSEKTHDLLVIGSGPAASSIMSRCAGAGWKVAVAEDRPLGGTCALRGCSPKKFLLAAAEAMEWVERLKGKGVDPGDARVNWADLMAFKNSWTGSIPANDARKLKDAGIELLKGRARFEKDGAVAVGSKSIRPEKVAIVTGARPAPLGIPGEEHILSSDEFLELPALPGEILFIGGGYISMEFATIAHYAGASTTVVHRGRFPLKGFDPELALALAEHYNEKGIRVVLDASAQRVERSTGGYYLATGGGPGRQLRADLIVHGAGRVPNLEGMNLEAWGITHSKGGVRVNEYQQSVSNPHVYAAGDCADTQGAALTPIAGREGRAAALNMLEGNRHMVDYTGCASVAFTLPNIASVGLTVKQAQAHQLEYRIVKGGTERWFTNRRLNSRCGAFKILVQEGTDRILGAHLLGHEAGELINLFALAIRTGLTIHQVRETLWAYPTAGADINRMLS